MKNSPPVWSLADPGEGHAAEQRTRVDIDQRAEIHPLQPTSMRIAAERAAKAR